jgi:hypothetical protein
VTVELDTSTPARERLAADLLGWGQRRPVAPPGLAEALRADLEAGLDGVGRERVAAAASTWRGGSLLVTKTGLDRLACDGWQLEPEPFEHHRASVRGTLAHAAIERDWDTERRETPDQVVARTWEAKACERPGDPRSLSWWLNHADADTAAALRTEVGELVLAFREVWPPLPAGLVRPRVERPVVVRLAGGAVTLRGVPDLVLDSRRQDAHARALVVDLKTGRPRSAHDRHELRFYALLVTLATGRPPFRWGTFYVTEGRVEAEDLHVDTLEATVRRVVDGVEQRVRLAELAPDARPGQPVEVDEGRLRLRAGAWCRDCRRLDRCRTAADAGVTVESPGQLGGAAGPATGP